MPLVPPVITHSFRALRAIRPEVLSTFDVLLAYVSITLSCIGTIEPRTVCHYKWADHRGDKTRRRSPPPMRRNLGAHCRVPLLITVQNDHDQVTEALATRLKGCDRPTKNYRTRCLRLQTKLWGPVDCKDAGRRAV